MRSFCFETTVLVFAGVDGVVCFGPVCLLSRCCVGLALGASPVDRMVGVRTVFGTPSRPVIEGLASTLGIKLASCIARTCSCKFAEVLEKRNLSFLEGRLDGRIGISVFVFSGSGGGSLTERRPKRMSCACEALMLCRTNPFLLATAGSNGESRICFRTLKEVLRKSAIGPSMEMGFLVTRSVRVAWPSLSTESLKVVFT